MDLTGINISDFLIIVVPSVAGIKRVLVAVAAWRKKRRGHAGQLPPDTSNTGT